MESYNEALADPDVAGVYFETPNYFGILEDKPGELCQMAREKQNLLAWVLIQYQ